MKENKIVHRDLKRDNILIKNLKNKKIIKLCDYGISILKEVTLLTSYCGTTGYISPEQKKPIMKSVIYGV